MSLFSQFPIMYTFKERINYCKVSEVGIDQSVILTVLFCIPQTHTQKIISVVILNSISTEK